MKKKPDAKTMYTPDTMTDKLMCRAAHKYRKWMMIIKSQKLVSQDKQCYINERLHKIINRSYDLQKWIQRFLNGNNCRIQQDPYKPHAEHAGIVNPDVYKNLATGIIPLIGQDITSYIRNMISTIKIIGNESVITPFSPRQAIEEIRIIHQRWNKVKFRNNILSVLIENITLEDESEEVYLGSFWIHLNLCDPIKMLEIESVDKILAEGTGYSHPHVDQGQLCSGDGGLLMKEAICQGRLEDYFGIVEAILRTYNENSPYRPLTEWYEPSREDQFFCENCGEWRDNEEYASCDSCGHITCSSCRNTVERCTGCRNYYCDECSASCAECGEVVCQDCSQYCNECENVFCSSCITTCKNCENYFCSACLGKCASCDDPICDSCLSKCDCCEKENCSNCMGECEDCNYNICNNCLKTCEHCGVSTCSVCNEKHNCLLAEIKK